MKTSKIIRQFLFVAVALSASVLCGAVKLPTTTVRGETRYYYDVQPRETVYGIAKKLGVSTEQIIEWNPSVAEGLKAGSRLYFPLSAFDDKVQQTHVVKGSESVYGISKEYDMTVERLLQLNPSASDGVRSGDRLVVEVPARKAVATAQSAAEEDASADNVQSAAPQSQAASPVSSQQQPGLAEAAGANGLLYEILPGETLYGIAMRHDMTVEDLLEANPHLDAMNYKSGTRIIIPVALAHQSAAAASPLLVAEPPVYADDEAGEEGTETVAEPTIGEGMPAQMAAQIPAQLPPLRELPDTVRVAVVLPLMLSEEQPARPAQLFTEFFRGMTLAAADMADSDGIPMSIKAFDSKGSAEEVISIMERPEMARMQLIVLPDDEMQIAAVSEGAADDTWMFNTFAVKDTSYMDTPRMIQANIPHTRMYELAIRAFDERFPEAVPVIVQRIEGQADKQPFVESLRQHFGETGRQYEEITFRHVLSGDDLESLRPDSINYVFIPITGSRTEFSKLTSALKRLQESGGSVNSVSLFGYPEWVTFRNEAFDELCDLNAVIYSRFYDLESTDASCNLQQAYTDAFGKKMFDAVPRQGVLGYDTGVYAILSARSIAETGAPLASYEGVQSSLGLRALGDEAGWVNDRLFIVSFRPGGKVDKQTIE